jgi:hypothetical protein
MEIQLKMEVLEQPNPPQQQLMSSLYYNPIDTTSRPLKFIASCHDARN